MQVRTVTIPNVELLAAGQWQSGQGPVSIDASWLDDVVAAANDPTVDRAPLKLGHYDRINDGMPAFGWVRNVRRVGNKVLGDLTEVPEKLAAIARVAYKRRSAELRRNVVGTNGTYKVALSGVALLGATPPAVKGLADLDGLFFSAGNVGELTIETATLSDKTTRHDDVVIDPNEGVIPMDPKKLRAMLSLAEDASDEQVEQALTVKLSAAKPDGVALIDEAVLADLKAKAEAGQRASEVLLTEKVERTLDIALSEGRIAPASVEVWRKRLTADLDGETIRLSELAPGVAMPVEQRGGRVDLAAGPKDVWTAEAINAVTAGMAGLR